MSMSTRCVGFKPPDAKWEKMKAIWDACAEAEVETPKEVDKFFNGESPDDAGVEVPHSVLVKCGAVHEWRDECAEGFELDISKLPEGVKIVRFYNSW